jgi:hypothetical protein
MGHVEELVGAYERFVALPWQANLAGQQRVWFLLYAPSEERRLWARFGEFEVATRRAGHAWVHVDLTDAFARWMAEQDYRESYFECPEDIELFLPEFADALAGTVRAALREQGGEEAVVAVSGIASLFGLARVSALVQAVAPDVAGRLLIFFPGERDGNNYRLLDAREGWNYLAVPITAGGSSE